jgi:hypothetical protein
MQRTPMSCRVVSVIDTILIKILSMVARRLLLDIQDFVVGGNTDEGGSWYAMTGGMSLLDRLLVAPL